MSRPAVDVVVPFAGSPAELAEVAAALGRLRREPGDTLTVVDNRPAAAPDLPAPGAEIRIVRAAERQSSYFARNRGAEAGTAPWIVFLDADTRAEPDLLDGYFDPLPGDAVGVLAGALLDDQASAADTLAARFAAARRPMSQEITVGRAGLGYAQTANCAVLRDAFAAVGGFADDIRSGGDADLCFRIQRAGWQLEARPSARAIHSNRSSLAALLRQRARHGSGAAWLDRRYPGTFPSGSRLGLIGWAAKGIPRATRDYRRGRREAARHDLVEIAAGWAFELGRHLPNTTRENRRRWTPLGRLLR